MVFDIIKEIEWEVVSGSNVICFSIRSLGMDVHYNIEEAFERLLYDDI